MRLSVLVVDDDPTVRAVLTALLGFDGVDIATATDGPSAVAMAEDEPPDVVLLDVNLPGMDGFEVCRRLKERAPEKPVVMLTARSSVDDERTGSAVGANAFLRKPFSPLELLDAVRVHLNGKGELLG